LSALSDEQLVESCKAGNKKHGELLYERYARYVANLIWKRFGDAEMAKELTQETFTKAFNGLKRFREESSFKTWLTRIAINCCNDYFRRADGEKHVSINDLENRLVKEVSDKSWASDPERQLSHKQVVSIVRDAIPKLSENHQTAILLRLEGLSYKEIAEIIGIPQGTAGRFIYEAKMVLKELLKPYLKGTNHG
jgi:RNA polymerase sigma-70 factor (ECF subfamily)